MFHVALPLVQTIYNALLNGTPCVILESSGRIADVIAQVAGLPVGRVTIALIQQLMRKFFGQEYESFTDLSIIEWTKKVRAPRVRKRLGPLSLCGGNEA